MPAVFVLSPGCVHLVGFQRLFLKGKREYPSIVDHRSLLPTLFFIRSGSLFTDGAPTVVCVKGVVRVFFLIGLL